MIDRYAITYSVLIRNEKNHVVSTLKGRVVEVSSEDEQSINKKSRLRFFDNFDLPDGKLKLSFYDYINTKR